MCGQGLKAPRTNKTNTIRGGWENYRLHALNGVQLRVEGSVRSVCHPSSDADTDIPGHRSPPANEPMIALQTLVQTMVYENKASGRCGTPSLQAFCTLSVGVKRRCTKNLLRTCIFHEGPSEKKKLFQIYSADLHQQGRVNTIKCINQLWCILF